MPVLVFLLTVTAFLPVLQNGFVNWDDNVNLLSNPNYRGLRWKELRWMFTDLNLGHYQPLSWVSLSLDYLLWGMNPLGYHLTSLILHVVNALLFYFIALRLLRLSVSVTAGESALRLAAGIAALFFALHPLRVEVVAWATERRGVLAGLFFLSSLLCYLKANADTSGTRLRWMSAAAALYGFSLLSKASGVMLPAVLLALDVYPLKRLGGGVREWVAASNRKVWLEKLPFLFLGLAAVAVTFVAEQKAGAIAAPGWENVTGSIGQALFGLTFYLWKTLIPAGLSHAYTGVASVVPAYWGFAPSRAATLTLSATVALTVSLTVFTLRRRWPAGITIWVCYVALLLPVVGLVQIGAQIAADRYSYLPTLGWALLMGAGVLYSWRRSWSRWTILGSGGVLVLFGIMSWRQAEVWHDSERLWRHALAVEPRSSLGRYNLGNVLFERGELEEAVEQYRQALRINPGHALTHFSFGNALYARGEFEEAKRQFRQALQINPDYAEAHYNLGNALYTLGDLDEAMAHYREALRIKPDFADAHNNLGLILARTGLSEDAINHYDQALRLRPDFAGAHNNLGDTFYALGRPEEAMRHYREALKSNPNIAQAHNNLGSILFNLGQIDDAIAHFRRALEIDPGYAIARHNLARAHGALSRALAAQGKNDEALQHQQTARRLLTSRGEVPPP